MRVFTKENFIKEHRESDATIEMRVCDIIYSMWKSGQGVSVQWGWMNSAPFSGFFPHFGDEHTSSTRTYPYTRTHYLVSTRKVRGRKSSGKTIYYLPRKKIPLTKKRFFFPGKNKGELAISPEGENVHMKVGLFCRFQEKKKLRKKIVCRTYVRSRVDYLHFLGGFALTLDWYGKVLCSTNSCSGKKKTFNLAFNCCKPLLYWMLRAFFCVSFFLGRDR